MNAAQQLMRRIKNALGEREKSGERNWPAVREAALPAAAAPIAVEREPREASLFLFSRTAEFALLWIAYDESSSLCWLRLALLERVSYLERRLLTINIGFISILRLFNALAKILNFHLVIFVLWRPNNLHKSTLLVNKLEKIVLCNLTINTIKRLDGYKLYVLKYI